MPYDPEFPRIKEIINAFAPIGVFIYLIKDEKNEDDLFALKLAAFELDIVKNSKAKKKKTDLRKAETKVEVLKILFQFMK